MVTCMKIVITSEFLSMFWWFGLFNAKPNLPNQSEPTLFKRAGLRDNCFTAFAVSLDLIFSMPSQTCPTNLNLPCLKWQALEATALLHLLSLLIWYSQCQAKPAHLIWTCPPLTTANGNNSRTGVAYLTSQRLHTCMIVDFFSSFGVLTVNKTKCTSVCYNSFPGPWLLDSSIVISFT